MGVYLSQPNTQKDSEDGQLKNGDLSVKYAHSSMQGWRTNMEDAHLLCPEVVTNISLFGVFDGHGGKEVAEFVSRHLIQELRQNTEFVKKNYEESLKQTFLKMDELLNTEEGKKELQRIKSGSDSKDSSTWNQDSYAGCTANVAILVQGKEIYVANAGDSRCILSRGGKAVELSFDHKPDNEKEKERVRKAGGFISEGRINGNLNLSRAIGDLEYKKNIDLKPDEQLISAYPDVTKHTLSADDEFMLMGCDGIYETLSNQDLIDFCRERLQKREQPKKILEDLLDRILAPDTSNGFGCDNMTTILVVFKDY